MSIVIKKKISLEILGEEYKDGYIIFQSLSVGEVEGLMDKLENIGDDNKLAVKTMLEILSKNFIEGVFVEGDEKNEIKAENIKDFDMATVVKFFQIMTGQDGDPKV